MKNNTTTGTLAIILTMLFIVSCGKEDIAPEPETHCYECTETTDTDRRNGYASVQEKTTSINCGLTALYAKKIEDEGTWDREQLDESGMNLIFVKKKTTCKKK